MRRTPFAALRAALLLAEIAVCATGCSDDAGLPETRALGVHGEPAQSHAAPFVTGDDAEDPAISAPASTGNRACIGVALPGDAHFVAPGLCATAVATQQGALRQITFASNGDLIAVMGAGTIVRYRDLDGDGVFSNDGEVAVLAEIHGHPSNAHLDEAAGYLYASADDGVRRWRYSADVRALDEGELVVSDVPTTGARAEHTVHVYDGSLYVHCGAEGAPRAAAERDYDGDCALIKRFALADYRGAPLSWSSGEAFAVGLRDAIGFKADATGHLYALDRGGDVLESAGADVSADNPSADLERLEPGAAFGYPRCFTAAHVLTSDGSVLRPGVQLASTIQPSAGGVPSTHDGDWCAGHSTEPVAMLPAHVTPVDLAFFDGKPSNALPEEWYGGIFVAVHGSASGSPSVGHAVFFVPLDAHGTVPSPLADSEATLFSYTVVFGGGEDGRFRDGAWGWSNGPTGEELVTPNGVAISPIDGALYVSSDDERTDGGGAGHGAIYRIALESE